MRGRGTGGRSGSLIVISELHAVDPAALIAVHRQARIPYANRPDEIGQLARALEVLQTASAEREILVEQAPIGISRREKNGKILSALWFKM